MHWDYSMICTGHWLLNSLFIPAVSEDFWKSKSFVDEESSSQHVFLLSNYYQRANSKYEADALEFFENMFKFQVHYILSYSSRKG